MKQKNPAIPIRPRHFLLTISVDRTSAQAPIEARPNPLINLNPAYTKTFVENVVMSEATHMVKHERKSKFLRPRDESASVAKMNPPSKQPKKKAEAGRPEIRDEAH